MENTKIWNRVYTCAFVANFAHQVAQYMVSPLVAGYAGRLGATAVIIGIISGLFYGVAFAARPFSGPAITKLNKKYIMIAAYAIGFLVNGSYALSSNLPLFIGARILHGVQFAFIGSLTLTIAGDSLPLNRMGSGVGLFGAGTAIAQAMAPGMGIYLRNWGDAAFGGNGGYTVVFSVAALIMLISIIPCAVMPYKPLSLEQKTELGAWYKSIIAKEAIPTSIVVVFVCFASILYTFFVESFAVEQGINNIGWFFTVYAIVLLISRPLSGRLFDKYGGKAVIYPGCVIFAVSFLVVGLGKSFTMVIIGAILAAIGYGTAQPSLQTICIKSVSSLRRGAASNTLYFGMDLGYWLGPSIGGFIVSSSSYATLYILTVIPIAIAVIVFTLSNRKIQVAE